MVVYTHIAHCKANGGLLISCGSTLSSRRKKWCSKFFA